MMRKYLLLERVLIALVITGLLVACTAVPAAVPATPTPVPEPQVQVVIDGLLGPLGLAALPDGGLLVAEEGTGNRDDSAGVSLLTADGRVGRLISGLRSARDSGDLTGVALVAVSPGADKIYLGHFGDGHLWTLPLTAEQQAGGLELPEAPLTTADLTPEMMPLNNVQLINPFDLTFDPNGVPVVTDASGNGVAKKNPDGTTRFFHRFDPLPDPTKPDSKFVNIQAVPTGITRVGDDYYVTLTGGCPYPRGSGRLVAIDEKRSQRTVASGLDMPIDVARGPDGTLWLLEFARFAPDASCFSGSGYQARTGRLNRVLPDGSLDVVLVDLNFPGAVLPMPDGSLYISEVFPGRILRVTFDGADLAARKPDYVSAPPAETATIPLVAGSEPRPEDYDRLLAEVIKAHGMQPYPGLDLREEDTPLARLGQALFFDPILSGDRNISCATCHHPNLAMADGRVLSIGTGGNGLGPQREFVEQVALGPEASFVRRLAAVTRPDTRPAVAANPFIGRFIPRNSLTIINSALFPRQFWDSRVESYALGTAVQTQERAVNALGLTDILVTQAMFPVVSTHEMAGATLGDLPSMDIRRALVGRLQTVPAYQAQFREVFGPGEGDAIDMLRIVQALAAFERRFVFTASPWDDYLAGQQDALTRAQKRGGLLFFGRLKPSVNCSQCHSGDLFTDFEHHNLLVPQLGPGKGHSYTKREDWGRAGVTFDLRDRYAFRTPSLRNVELTAPYFHSGAFATLAGAIRHHADIEASALNYDPSAHGVPPAFYSSVQPFQPDKQLPTAALALRHGLPLTETDVADLVAFLTSLTDPAAANLGQFIPDSVPSGLPLDPLPETPGRVVSTAINAEPNTRPAGDTPDTSTGAEVQFRNVADQVGLDFRHGVFQTDIFEDPAAAMGAGLCWIDYDNDGWLDLYLVNSYAEDEADYWHNQGGLPVNRLYRNDRGRFTDVSQAAGVDLSLRGNGCVAADFNGDGWWDLYVTADGPNALLWNNGDGTFSEGAAEAGVAAPEWNSAAAVGDLNGDGWPDLFVAAYINLNHKIPKPAGAFPQDYYGLPDRLYLNSGPGLSAGGRVTFREISREAGLVREERGLGALLSDLDRDGDLELYIANDGQPNRLYLNEAWPGGPAADPLGLGFRFLDATGTAHVGDSGSGMGVAGGDYDGDGLIDLFVTNWEREVNALYRNLTAEQGFVTFQYSTYRIGISGLGNGMTGWGTAWLDFDHDTDQDLLVVNGRVPVTNLATDPQLVRLYRNRSWTADGQPGRPGQFVEWTQVAGLKEEVGPLLARGSAVADYDNDGDLDIAINNIAGPAILLENSGPPGHWLQVSLAGFQPGALAMAELPDGRQLVRELYAGSSYLASEDPRFHFGLGPYDRVARLTVHWPDGWQVQLENIPAGQLLHLPAPTP